MKKIKTYPNHLEIITSVFIPYKDFDLEDSGDNMITGLIKIL